MMDTYLFTSESVSEGHPDKIADQISDALLDDFLRRDAESKVACETLVTTGLVVLSGEVNSKAYVDVQTTARKVIENIGYTSDKYRFDAQSCGVISTIHEQSPDINQGVVQKDKEEQGAGDQGLMFGYAINETEEYMPLPLTLSHAIVRELATIRKEKKQMLYLRPDSKSQVTVEYDLNNKAVKIHTIVVSTQHDDFDEDEAMSKKIREDVANILIPRVKSLFPEKIQTLFKDDYILHVNPTGKFVIGGPHGDTGLTGRKIIVDTYGGKGAHGGGAFSGKDPSKVDRSAAYAARYIAKNMVAAGVADEVLVQIAYAIGIAKPVSININTYGTSKLNISDIEIGEIINKIFGNDLRPAKIIERFALKNPIYEPTASYGHFGRASYLGKAKFIDDNGNEISKEIEFFTWEKTDSINEIKKAFGLA
ncbi:MAG: methionine adenosyltransferase [Prevotellaceae bacterium]|jgi:S-adenosylmethionine synthetase|nr:methionine adenosyltransferase [Prevotellaceae bacterium]